MQKPALQEAGLMGSLKARSCQTEAPARCDLFGELICLSGFVRRLFLDVQHFQSLSEARDPRSLSDSGSFSCPVSLSPRGANVCLLPLITPAVERGWARRVVCGVAL